MIKRIQLFLGPARERALVLLAGTTGFFSLVLNAIVDQYAWVTTVQSLLVIVFLAGTAVIFGGRMQPDERSRWLRLLLPVLVVVTLGLLFFPQYLALALGASLGWIAAGLIVFRDRGRGEYKTAIRLLRKQNYKEAAEVMDELIKAEPDEEQHYRLRAEILRLWDKLGRARRDYEKMIAINPRSAVGYNGLAEVCLQAGDYAQAREAGLKAMQLSPGEWVAVYNLGMIEDRLGESQAVIGHLQQALALRVPDGRHRLLIHLYLARAYSRLGNMEAANDAIAALKKHQGGLEEWQVILKDEMASVLRDVLAEDVQTAEALIDGERDAASLSRAKSRVKR